LVDNLLVMHGRRTFRGTRKVLASLTDKQTQKFSRSAKRREAVRGATV
jgi:hypothetical protein